jgi:phosphatidylserine/phosphatidylglycerophosphate/cardiolipin synthase-like enzyme
MRLSDQAFSRAAGAPLIAGNSVRVLKDAAENYPAWEAAIAGARRSVHVEMYILHDDHTGRRFRDLLAARARAGVRVRLLYDWFGSWTTSRRFYRALLEAGGEVRAMNPPALADPLGVVRRDHRKLITVDGEVAFVGGLCIGQAWEGDPGRNVPPWRDTGIELRGPAVADAERAFLDSWVTAGGTIHPVVPLVASDAAGDVPVRLIPTVPATANLLTLDLLVASLARHRLWITDAYFVASTAYMKSLQRAAGDGVDVRLLLPASSDLQWIAAASRTQYRPLLQAGVRIFEWNGSMLHAKTAVADSLWTRVGSTNLNVASWLGNWEIDVAIEHGETAARMETLYEDDLGNSTEIVLAERRRFRAGPPRVALAHERRRPPGSRLRGTRSASARRLVGEGSRLGSGLKAVVTGHRELEDYERWPVVFLGAVLLGLAVLGFWTPRLLAFPLAAICGLAGAHLGVRTLWRWLRRSGPWRGRSLSRGDPLR